MTMSDKVDRPAPTLHRETVRMLLRSAVVLGVFCLISYQAYSTTVANWLQTAESLSIAVTAYTEQILTSSALVLRSVDELVREAGASTEAELRDAAKSGRLFDPLRGLMRTEPQIDVVSIVALNGDLLTYSRSFPSPVQNLSDRDYLRQARDIAQGQVFLSDPVRNKTNGTLTFYLARALHARSGELIGVAIVGIQSASLARFYNSLSLGSDSSILLFKSTGLALARSRDRPGSAAADVRLPSVQSLFDEGPQSRARIVREDDPLQMSNSTVRIQAPRRLEHFPAFTVVAIGEDLYLRSWWRANLFVGSAALVAWFAVVISWRRNLRLIAERSRLQEQEQTTRVLAAVFEHPSALVAVMNRAGEVVYANGRFWNLFGNGGAQDVRCFSRGDVRGANELLDFADRADDGRQQSRDFQISVAVDGRRRSLMFSGAPQHLTALGPCIVLSGFDETERLEAQAALLQSAKLVTLGEMATGIAHELNQPLFAISMAVQNAQHMLKSANAGDGPAAADRSARLETLVSKFGDQFARILAQVNRASTIVRNVRMFGRATDTEPVPFDVREACRAAMDVVGEQLRLAGVELSFDPPDEALPVFGLQNAFEQVIVNLLVNARDSLQANQPGNRKVKITVARRLPGEEVHVRVADNGPGVPPEVRARIFDPFFTTKPTGKGVGLGLSLSYGIVRDMKGKLTLLSETPGAVFEISLPALH
jgi:C4-dicarboxylate-specific signal transduction histidine kinase